MTISIDTQKEILKLARETIEKALFGESKIKVFSQDPVFNEISGIFVTLHKKNALRGCIGNIIGYYPLKEGIPKMALAAAFEDPRFTSLKKNEYDQIDLEVTVLSPLQKASLSDIVPGKHGVVLSKGYHKSTYLPQVWEQIPDLEDFMSSLAEKGGMDSDAWKNPDITIEIYTGLVISEK